MKTTTRLVAGLAGIGLAAAWVHCTAANSTLPTPRPTDPIGGGFYINSDATYQGWVWWGYKISGLLLNARLVHGIFSDRNMETVER